MTIRITGLSSGGLDTDSIISELMKAQRTKIETVQKKKTSTEWKADAWSTLNSKIYSLYTGSLNTMRFTDAYNKKTTSISDTKIASVTADSTAVNGTQDLAVKQLAKSGYLTGGTIATPASSTLSSSTTLKELTGLADTDSGTLQVTTGSGTPTSITFNGSSKISDVISQLKSAGVNASFDATNKRIFVSSKSSGEAGDFSLTSTDTNGGVFLDKLGLSASSGAVKIDGQDAKIALNGAEFTSTSNSFSINGLNITAKELSASTTNAGTTTYSTTSITTTGDTQAVYDQIKKFFKEYNTLINEMDSLYNAKSAKGYEPLTDDEKESMTDTQIEKWETKIKDALLRRDGTLGDVSSAMKSAMSETFEINGTKYSLASFGIATGSYFTTEDNEHNAYHIDGDSDDSTVSTNKDKLMTAISSDPNAVVNFFTSLSKGLYDTLSSKMKSIDGVRSAYKVYEDKSLASDIEDYEDKIDDMEDKFTEMEDKYYKQFSAMETALSKLQSSSSSLSSLLGS